MRILISGGCKNGKSYYAQHIAQSQWKTRQSYPLYYIATMKPVDREDDERITRHKKERSGWGFTTIEQPTDIENILQNCDHNGSFLLDSLTALLANEMFSEYNNINDKAALKIKLQLSRVLEKIDNIVIVSDYIYSDAALYDQLTEKYRKSLAEIDYAAARLCDAVLEITFTCVTIHKGNEIFDAAFKKIF